MVSFNSSAACYCLAVAVPEPVRVEVGSLGYIDCPAGWLYYAGRARGGWGGRIKRFLKENQTNFWHIDYLVNESRTDLRAVLPVHLPAEAECELASFLEAIAGFKPLPEKFGASDCSAGCQAHAWSSDVDPATAFARLKEADLPVETWVEFTPRRCIFHKIG
ncbi:MAG: DUF123 domain-containing protein [bacterium]